MEAQHARPRHVPPSTIHRPLPVDNFDTAAAGPGTLFVVTSHRPSGAEMRRAPQGDAAVLLRRISRHVPLETDRLVLALVRLSRCYVDGAAWLATPPATGKTPVGVATVRELIRPALISVAPAEPTVPPTHAVAMVRCRRGRVVWLPSDDLWTAALTAESARVRMPLADVFLVTEFGWRSRPGNLAGYQPALAA